MMQQGHLKQSSKDLLQNMLKRQTAAVMPVSIRSVSSLRVFLLLVVLHYTRRRPHDFSQSGLI